MCPYSASVAAAAAALFPGEWWRALSAEPLASLIVDALAGAVCDSLLDDLVATLESDAAEGLLLATSPSPPWGAEQAEQETSHGHAGAAWAASGQSQRQAGAMSQSASAPGGSLLQRPQVIYDRMPRLPHQTHTGATGSTAPWSSSIFQETSDRGDRRRATDGFTQAGLPKSSMDSWSTGRYHACKPLSPYTRRIQEATELQRPKRRISRPVTSELQRDHRKFNWPMAATNFPQEWNEATRKRTPEKKNPNLVGAAARISARLEEEEQELLGIGRDGKTTFPYSLALHKAFLESQPNPVLKEKALKVAPLRTTGSWYS